MAKPPSPRITFGDRLRAKGVALPAASVAAPPQEVHVVEPVQQQQEDTHMTQQAPQQIEERDHHNSPDGKTARLERLEASNKALNQNLNSLAQQLRQALDNNKQLQENQNLLNDQQENIMKQHEQALQLLQRLQQNDDTFAIAIRDLSKAITERPVVVEAPKESKEDSEMKNMMRMFFMMQMAKGGGGAPIDPQMAMMLGFGPPGGLPQGNPQGDAFAKLGSAATLMLTARMVGNMGKSMGMDKATVQAVTAATLGIAHQPVESGWQKAIPVVGGVIGQAASGAMQGLARAFGDAKWGSKSLPAGLDLLRGHLPL